MIVGSYQHLIVEKKGEKQNVGYIRLNRPKALNALFEPLMLELNEVLAKFDADPEVGCIILTGGEKVFAGNYNMNVRTRVLHITT